MHSTAEIQREIESWLRGQLFTFYTSAVHDGGMIVVRFQKLEGFDFEIDLTFSSQYCEICSYLLTAADSTKRKELKNLADLYETGDLHAGIEEDGNFTILTRISLSERDLQQRIADAFWNVFSCARRSSEAVRAVMMEKAQADEAYQMAEEKNTNAGWEKNVPYTIQDYPDRF